MKQRRYTLSFTTPAFMGNAEQNAQWRTPPSPHHSHYDQSRRGLWGEGA